MGIVNHPAARKPGSRLAVGYGPAVRVQPHIASLWTVEHVLNPDITLCVYSLAWHRGRVLSQRVLSRQSKGVFHSAQGHVETNPSTREIPEHFTVISADGKWKIRKIDGDNLAEIRKIVELQAEGFHTPNPFPFVDGFLKTSFKAEVLSEMQKKLKYNPKDKFVCLIVEHIGEKNPVGVVEVSYIDEKEVLQSLEPGTQGVVYIASMTVSSDVRRQGAAKALLEAAVEVTREWNENTCVLHVYQDNIAAIELYKKQGFGIIFADAAWLMKLAVRPRFLMRKSLGREE